MNLNKNMQKYKASVKKYLLKGVFFDNCQINM